MSKCRCEHWESCPVCYPQGFDIHGGRIPSKPYKTREELLVDNAAQVALIERIAFRNMTKRDMKMMAKNFLFPSKAKCPP